MMTAWVPHVLLVLITAAALVIMLGSWGTLAPATVICMNDEMREHVRGLMLAGLEAGFKEYTSQLYANRLKDRDPKPDRIIRGMHGAILAYTRSRYAVKQWDPPAC